MTQILSLVSGRDHRGLDGDRWPGGDRPAPLAAQRSAGWRRPAFLFRAAKPACRRRKKAGRRHCRQAIEA